MKIFKAALAVLSLGAYVHVAGAQGIGIRTMEGMEPTVVPISGGGGYGVGNAIVSGVAQAYQGSVKKLSDASATCRDLEVEVTQLEDRLQKSGERLRAAQESANAATSAMTSSGGSGAASAVSTAASLLSMVPGVGIAAGIAGSVASTAAAGVASAQIHEQSARMSKAHQEMYQIGNDMGLDQARRDHLVELFLARNCKTSGRAETPVQPSASGQNTTAPELQVASPDAPPAQ